MKSTSLTEFMLNDHAITHKLFMIIEKNIGQNTKSLLKSIEEFKWKLEKHYFVEEKAIFTAYDPEDENEDYTMISKLLIQHGEILKKLKMFKKSVKKNKAFNIQGFKELLTNHKNFEEEKLYPKLEEELPEPEKTLIIKRINEIL